MTRRIVKLDINTDLSFMAALSFDEPFPVDLARFDEC